MKFTGSSLFVPMVCVLAAASAALAAEVHIDQVNQKFSKTSLSVSKNDKVIFKNSDSVTHNINVIDSNNNPDDKGLQEPGQSIEQVFSADGEFQVRCSIHPKMKMTVSVK